MTRDELEELATRFLRQEIARAEWTHAAHLAVGAWHVHRFGADDAIARLRTGICALNDRHGTANTDTSGYHETITVAHVHLIAEFLEACADPLETRVARLLGSPLAQRDFLFRFWSRAVLMSAAARRSWTAPDLADLALPAEARSAARAKTAL